MLWLFVGLAFAEVPAGVDLDDLDGWEQRSRALLDGPAGCWELSGRATVQFSAYTSGGMLGRATQHDMRSEGWFKGRIEDGTWTSFRFALEKKEGKVDLDFPLIPMEGKIDAHIIVDETPPDPGEPDRVRVAADGESKDPGNLVDQAFDNIDFATALSWVEWRGELDGLLLIEEVPLEDGRDPPSVKKTTFFPQGGRHGTKVDVMFPPKLRLGEDMIKVSVMDGQLHLRGVVVEDVLLPGVSGMSVLVGVLGYTGGYEQRMLYQEARRCEGGKPLER